MVRESWSQRRGSIECTESCLSLPGQRVKVPRAHKITVEYLTPNGPKTKKYKGLFAVAIQHEIDHLDGRLIMDYEVEARLKEAKAKGIK